MKREHLAAASDHEKLEFTLHPYDNPCSMSTAVLSHGEHAGHVKAPPETCKFGMITFLASEAMLFGGLIGGIHCPSSCARANPGRPPGAPDIGVQWPLSSLNLVMIANTLRSGGQQLSVSRRRIGH